MIGSNENAENDVVPVLLECVGRGEVAPLPTDRLLKYCEPACPRCARGMYAVGTERSGTVQAGWQEAPKGAGIYLIRAFWDLTRKKMELTSGKRLKGRAGKSVARRRGVINCMVCCEDCSLFHIAGMNMQDLGWILQ